MSGRPFRRQPRIFLLRCRRATESVFPGIYDQDLRGFKVLQSVFSDGQALKIWHINFLGANIWQIFVCHGCLDMWCVWGGPIGRSRCTLGRCWGGGGGGGEDDTYTVWTYHATFDYSLTLPSVPIFESLMGKWTEPWVPHCIQRTLQDFGTSSGHSCHGSGQLWVRLTYILHSRHK